MARGLQTPDEETVPVNISATLPRQDRVALERLARRHDSSRTRRPAGASRCASSKGPGCESASCATSNGAMSTSSRAASASARERPRPRAAGFPSRFCSWRRFVEECPPDDRTPSVVCSRASRRIPQGALSHGPARRQASRTSTRTTSGTATRASRSPRASGHATAAQLGHAKNSLTLDVYGHVLTR
jgi:hypothetical protein